MFALTLLRPQSSLLPDNILSNLFRIKELGSASGTVIYYPQKTTASMDHNPADHDEVVSQFCGMTGIQPAEVSYLWKGSEAGIDRV